jgi:hypothetical protein
LTITPSRDVLTAVAEQRLGPPEQTADKMKSGNQRQANEIFLIDRNVPAHPIEP